MKKETLYKVTYNTFCQPIKWLQSKHKYNIYYTKAQQTLYLKHTNQFSMIGKQSTKQCVNKHNISNGKKNPIKVVCNKTYITNHFICI